ncbi:MAG: T9SS type A sorting domain-containing protein [Candidatus Cloacimonetes bacterium]|nr:T9SS type A sorting domain-containing protein [Candidatus Cloacimonadota bacterium]
MKLKFIIIALFILHFTFLFSDTIIDSVYSDPVLDGYIYFSQNAQAYLVNNWMYDMGAGDSGFSMIDPDPNSHDRSYISFNLPEIPENYYIDSVFVRVYQFMSGGYDASIGEYTDFPVWDIAGGDTIKCIMSHIDYGNELDVGDWEKGDVGNPYTYQNNIGTITESGEEDYRYLDVTTSVIQDYELNRDKTQYRIAFQINTDWDNETDLVAFLTGSTQSVWARPQVFIRFTDEINSLENDEIPLGQSLNFEIYPNPVNNIFGVLLSRKDVFIKKFDIFNVKGQKVKSFDSPEIMNGSRLSIDSSKMPSGIYLMKLITENEVAVKKFLIMH